MKCQKCQFENPQDILFCGRCGFKLSNKCPHCSFTNPPHFTFCGECGRSLQDSQAIASTIRESPRSYTPKFLADKILKNRSTIEGEHKVVTVLFADVARYTSISERLNPETVHNIMDGCFKVLMDAVHHYEGTVNQFLGDGIMALFGAPVAYEDHAQRSCYAALSIQRGIEEFGAKVKRDTGFDFKMRIGINTGPVIVGTIGDDLRMDYTAVGDTTNLGARMVYNAEPGSIMLSGNTHRLVRDFFKFNPLGKVRIEGKQEPQEAYELLTTSEVRTRIEASEVKGLTSFVGRKNSIPALLNSYEHIKSETGLVVGLVGDAGVGKSRLLLEMRRRLTQDEFTYLEGRCLQYGNSLAYLPILDILRSYLEINEEEGETEINNKLAAKLLDLDAFLGEAIPPLQALLGLEVDDDRYQKLEPVEKRAQTFDALRNLFLRLSKEKYLVIAIEDLHWVDKTSEDFLDHFIGGLANTPILLILVYRPEYLHRWGSKSYYKRIGVTQLGTDSSSEMVKAILKGSKVDAQLIRFILDRASGNPLFMEEFIFTLLEKGAIVKKDDEYVLKEESADIEIPTTVQGIIAARLDHLEANLKRTMQVASVIGRVFAYRILQSTLGLQGDLKSYLMNLQSLELISEKNIYPDLEYIFKHALIQEVAYDSLLPLQKKGFHRKVGEAMKTYFVGRIGEYASLIGEHFMRGEAWESAYEYLVKAGDDAARLYAHAEARFHYSRAIKALTRLDDTKQNRRRRVDTVIKQTLVSWRADSPEQNLKRLSEANRLADEIAAPIGAPKEDLLRLARIRFWMGRVHYSRGEMEQAIGLFRQVLPVAQKFNDEELLSIPAGALGQTMAVLGHLNEAAKMLGQAASIFEHTANWPEWIQAKAFRGTAVACMGEYRQGEQEVRQALSRAEELNFLPGICVGHNCLGYAYLFGGELDKAIEAAQAAIQVSGQSGERIYAYVGSGIAAWAACRKGLPTEASSHLARCKAIAQELGGRVIMGDLFATAAAEIAFEAHQFEKAVSLAQGAIQIAKPVNGILAEGVAHRVWGRALYASDAQQWDEAQSHLAQSVKILEAGQNTNEVARTHETWGLLYRDQGQNDLARKYWQKAAHAYENAGLVWELEKVKTLLNT